MQEKDLAPWEVPPDESYWQALLQEEEDVQNGAPVAIVAGPAPSPTAPADEPPSRPTEAPSPLPVDRPADPISSPVAPDAPAPVVQSDAEGTAPDATLSQGEQPSPASDAAPAQEFSPPQPDRAVWQHFYDYQDAGTAIELTVESYNRGGLLVRWQEVMGFVPASQLCDGLRYGDEQTRLKDLAMRVGTSLSLKVIEVDPDKNRLILSERAARHVEDPDLDVLDDLSPGDVCHGQVTNLCTFGAFIDLGGVEGLIHISELSWGRVSHPADILQSGQPVDVYVLNVDRDQGRVGLSLKRLQPDPWTSVDERYQVGQVIEGEITNIVNFGAFVRLEEGLEGLIHTSEFGGVSASGPYSLREGERVLVRINSIEGDRHRIGLSLE